MKSSKIPKQGHTARTKMGSGDYYGQAIPAKVGRIKSIMDQTILPKKKINKPPKSLA